MRLNEVSRIEYQNKSKQSDNYVPDNLYNGKNRFERRLKLKVDRSIAELNRIDMNKFFSSNVLSVNILVHGETDDYLVTVTFGDVLDKLHQELNKNEGELTLRVIIRAIVSAFNGQNVYTRCTCPDYQYRIAYHASQEGAIAGQPETRPSDITNPNNTKGLSCKHVQAVLNNNNWLQRLGSVLWNYIRYMEVHYEQLYASIIYPAIYEKVYEKPVQMDFINNDKLATDRDDIDTANIYQRTKNYIKPGWNKIDDEEPTPKISGQKSFDFDSLVDDDYPTLN